MEKDREDTYGEKQARKTGRKNGQDNGPKAVGRNSQETSSVNIENDNIWKNHIEEKMAK